MDFQSDARGQGVDPTHPLNLGHLMHEIHGMWWLLEKTNICLEKKARTYKNFQLCFWIILELKTIERRSLYLRHPGMSLNLNFKVLERLPDFLVPKIKSRRLCSETNSTSLPRGFLCTEKIKSTTGQFHPKSLPNLTKFSTNGWTISRAFLSYKN